ncbi:MAG: hypothetical protein ABJO36_09450 [Litorimonas sp.]
MNENPFFHLYVGERVSSRDYLKLFSPVLVNHIGAVFSPGNVVLTGVTGCGKSMLLGLLKPEIRLEYYNQDIEFPVPRAQRKFLSANVHLAQSNAFAFGYRSRIDENVLETELLFGDFLNYLMVSSFFKNLKIYCISDEAIRKEVGLNFDASLLDEVSKKIANLTVWNGWLSECETYSELMKRFELKERLYDDFLHGKAETLSESILDSMTYIGQPMIEVVKALKEESLIDADTEVFVDIDQYEEIGNISSRRTPGQSVDYRAVINKALASRTPFVSYRIGTRGYSWKKNVKIHGTSGNLEEERHYKKVDLDSVLKRAEHEKDVFKDFARDVFKRRLDYAKYLIEEPLAEIGPKSGNKKKKKNPESLLSLVYGKTISIKTKINSGLGLKEPHNCLRFDKGWRPETKSKLLEMSKTDLYSAKLGEIWIRQKGDGFDLGVSDDLLPWVTPEAYYWRKERARAVLMQVCSLANQRMVWGGEREILALCGGSILSFIGMNQAIWDSWLRRHHESNYKVPKITIRFQSVGIYNASRKWVEMIGQESSRSAERQRFVKFMATYLRQKLISDKNLAYPGGSGFSVIENELNRYPDLQDFLQELADYGNLIMLDHKTKSSNRLARKKFYFNPIYCPYFALPYARTKEPIYASVHEVITWVYDSGYNMSLGVPKPPVQEKLL